MVRLSRRTANLSVTAILMERNLRRNLYLASLVVRRSGPGDTLAWYHTGDDDLDEFLDRNADIVEKALYILAGGLLERGYRKRFGVMPVWHVLVALAAKSGADALGYYFSRTIDPEFGAERWNEFHERVYSWYGLEEFEVWDVGIGLLPNPLALAEVTGESLQMIGEAYTEEERKGVSAFTTLAKGRVLNAPAVNPFFLAEQIYYYTNPSYRVGTGMGGY